jgi:hypothetical protein
MATCATGDHRRVGSLPQSIPLIIHSKSLAATRNVRNGWKADTRSGKLTQWVQ